MKKTTLVFGLLLLAILPLRAQQIVDVHQSGNRIVIEYDLSQPAEFVRLYVSTDNGKSYRGPLKNVEGDVSNVQPGYNKSITWDVLKEFKTFESDEVKFKLSIKFMEKWPNEFFATLNGAFSPAPQTSFGFSIGQVKHYGWFVSVMTNGGFTGTGGIPRADAHGYLDGGYLPAYNGNTTTDRFSVIAGGVVRISRPVCLRTGLGYGFRNLCWQDNDKQWYKIGDYSVNGIDLSAGVQVHLNSFAISFEGVTTQFQTIEAKLGLGYVF